MLLGAQFVFSQQAVGITSRSTRHIVTLSDGSELVARAVIVATGVSYRRLDIPALDRLAGMGVFYGAASSEAIAVTGQRVCVVGGANSAGQAALQLAKYAAHVTILVRGDSLDASMSDYLIREIEATPNIDVRTRTHVVDGHGDHHLESLVVVHAETGSRERLPAAAAFIMIGASPHTRWMTALQRDPIGYVLTGPDIPDAVWPLSRPPMLLETSLPGVFAAGDVRSGSVKRVVSAVGDGGVVIGLVHRYLAGAMSAMPDTSSSDRTHERYATAYPETRSP